MPGSERHTATAEPNDPRDNTADFSLAFEIWLPIAACRAEQCDPALAMGFKQVLAEGVV